MDCKLITAFDTVSQRVIYNLRLLYSEFTPVLSENTSVQSQKTLHGLMKLILDKLYENPGLLNLSNNADEAYEWYEVNNMKPQLDKVYQSVFKGLFEFYKFMYISALHGKIKDSRLLADAAVLKEHKASYKPQYQTLLNEIDINVNKEKSGIALAADSGVLQSLKLLAKNVPVDINPWRPYALLNFACCLYADDYGYLLPRFDALNGLNGLLLGLRERCLDKGYKESVSGHMSTTCIDLHIFYKNKIGGFRIVFSSRKTQPFNFGTINGIGQKAMLADFDSIGVGLQKHFINICRTCNGCLACTKGGKSKIYTSDVTYGGTNYKLCPSFHRDSWDSLNHELIDVLFAYHDAQEKYGVDWKKK